MRALARDWREVAGEVVRSGSEPGFRYAEIVYDMGISQPNHSHRSAFFALSLDGQYWEEVGGKVFECTPHTVIFHPPAVDHAVTVVISTSRCFLLELDTAEIADRYQVRPSATVVHAHGGPMAAALQEIYDEVRVRDDCSPLAVQGLLLQLLAGASRSAVELDYASHQTLTQVGNVLRDRFRERLTLEDIASSVGGSPTRVSRLFRTAHRRTIADEQRRLRIEYACQRMHDRATSLAEIAREAGFADQAHFSRAFKRVTGMTPARYRRKVEPVCDPHRPV